VAAVDVTVRGDIDVEANETFSLVITPTSEVKNGSPAHVGIATIVNNDSIHQTIRGTEGNDKLYGYEGDDILYGYGGNDVLNGGTGVGTRRGGKGNDTYYVDNVGDRVIELSGEGTDSVRSSISYTLGNHVENLTLTGTRTINATGNSLANRLTGNAKNNVLDG